MQPFEQLKVWQCAHALAVEIHGVTAGWRDFDLRSQLRRCAASVGANITEGAASLSRRQFARFLGYAYASATELRYHLRYARDVGLLATEQHGELDARAQESCRMLTGLLRALHRAEAKASPLGRRAPTPRRSPS